MSQGIAVKLGEGGSRLEVECTHQNGVLYVVPGEASWVCTEELRPAHALAGFLKELAALEDPRVRGLMRRWGLYFRPRPLATPDQVQDSDTARET